MNDASYAAETGNDIVDFNVRYVTSGGKSFTTAVMRAKVISGEVDKLRDITMTHIIRDECVSKPVKPAPKNEPYYRKFDKRRLK